MSTRRSWVWLSDRLRDVSFEGIISSRVVGLTNESVTESTIAVSDLPRERLLDCVPNVWEAVWMPNDNVSRDAEGWFVPMVAVSDTWGLDGVRPERVSDGTASVSVRRVAVGDASALWVGVMLLGGLGVRLFVSERMLLVEDKTACVGVWRDHVFDGERILFVEDKTASVGVWCDNVRDTVLISGVREILGESVKVGVSA